VPALLFFPKCANLIEKRWRKITYISMARR
jgi:hypothetical protein